MRKLTTTVAAMAVTMAVFGQNPGSISAVRVGQAITMHPVNAPTDNLVFDLLKCRMEITWIQSGAKKVYVDCDCQHPKTVVLPSWAVANSFEVRRRCFWQSKSGTIWKWGNTVNLN